jgi:hypothetical protein
MNSLFFLVNCIKVVCSGSCGWLWELVTENRLSSFHLKVRGSSGVQSCTVSTLVAIIHPLLFQTVAGVFGLESKVYPQLKGFILDKLPFSEQALSCFEYVCTWQADVSKDLMLILCYTLDQMVWLLFSRVSNCGSHVISTWGESSWQGLLWGF